MYKKNKIKKKFLSISLIYLLNHVWTHFALFMNHISYAQYYKNKEAKEKYWRKTIYFIEKKRIVKVEVL